MSSRWQEIEVMLSDRIGLDPQSVGSSLIPRAATLRMDELGLESLDDYVSLLAASATEIQALIEEVIIPESWFFRDQAPFRFFQDHVRAFWLSNPGRAPLRVLSIPCAGGEEPFSIVIALLEIGMDLERFQVDAVDVSSRRLEAACRGVFSQNAFRGSELTFRDRYFQSHPQGFALDPKIRAGVRFIQGSIMDSSLLAGAPPYDVVFCRNLLIYLDGSSHLRAMAMLDRLLAADGRLIIGHADRLNLGKDTPWFSLIGEPRAFTYRRVTALPPAQAFAALPPPRPSTTKIRSPANPAPRRASPPAQPLAGALGEVVAWNPDRPRLPVDSRSGSSLDEASSGGLLEKAAMLANLGQHGEAITACEQYLRAQGPSAVAYYLLGVIHQSQGDRSRGEECFHKAVYLDPGHDEALLALALLAERRGDSTAAATFRRRAERAAVKKGVR